ncbi:hypothetical protein TWF173_001659 [Orbilia oligospora]|nr:hypothetical protein TWF173_001659 [Orbilia oligospora]
MRQAINPVLLSFLFSFSFYTVARTKASDTPRCYYPDGRLRNSTDYQPCNNVVGQHSMCCALANRGSGGDLCLPNGLCSAFTADGSQTALWRESCTDPTWEDPACLKICLMKGKGYNWVKWDAPITVCRDGTICCGNKEDLGGVCCKEGKGIQIAATLRNTEITPIVTSSRLISSDRSGFVSTATITTLVTSSPNPNSTGGPDSSPNAEIRTSGASTSSAAPTNQALSSIGMPDTTKIAIGVGIPLLVIAVVLVVFLFRWRSKRLARKSAPPVYEKNSIGPVEIGTSNIVHYRFHPAAQELDSTSPPATSKHHINIHELQ